MNKTKTADPYTRKWIIHNAQRIVARYAPGELTLRALHYQLVSIGMTNTMQHYKRVVAAMELARWNGDIPFTAFSDLERRMEGFTAADATDLEEGISYGRDRVAAWMNHFYKNRWENQPIYPELFIEKKALQAVFQGVCDKNNVGLGAVKGYPSLTFLYEAAQRFKAKERDGKECVILYFGDYDPSGEDIPRSIQENLRRMGANVEVKRFALFLKQVRKWKLPHAPAKETDSRYNNWDGIGQVELDAVPPETLKALAQDAINTVFDHRLHVDLIKQQEIECTTYKAELKKFVKSLK